MQFYLNETKTLFLSWSKLTQSKYKNVEIENSIIRYQCMRGLGRSVTLNINLCKMDL
jgi:hypothetical protein